MRSFDPKRARDTRLSKLKVLSTSTSTSTHVYPFLTLVTEQTEGARTRPSVSPRRGGTRRTEIKQLQGEIGQDSGRLMMCANFEGF